MFDNQIRPTRPQLVEPIVARQHGARKNAAMFRGLDVMLHIADEQGFPGMQFVFRKNLMNFCALVPHAKIRPFEIFVKPVLRRLRGKVIAMHRAQQERPQAVTTAKIQKVASVRQFLDQVLDLEEMSVEPNLQLFQRDLRGVAIVELLKGQAEFRAELLQRQFRKPDTREHIIGRAPDRRQIVHQRARPIKNDIANHRGILAEDMTDANA